jgi:hypothetical protein
MSILINLEHTVEEVNSILGALAERPFKEVADLIGKIQAKGRAAIDASQADTQPIDAPTPEADSAPAEQ